MFRVYDDKEGCWIADNVYLTQNNELVMIKQVLGMAKMPITLDKDRYIYHRAINLRDVNGVEVFEGDYVLAKVSEDKSIIGLVTFAEELSAYIVLSVNDTEYYTLGSDVSEFIEVVGNVFDGCDDKKYN